MSNVVVVTGDSGDLGFSICKLLLENNDFYVVGISRRRNDKVQELEKKENFLHIAFDLTKPDNIKDLFIHSIRKTGKLYGLVNNAAYAYDDIVTNAHIDSLDRMYKINVYSPVILTKYAIREMLLNNIKGSLVYITSICAHTGYKGLSMYASTKGALESFSKTVAREWGGRGIRSNCVAPGFMETEMSLSLSSEQRDRIFKRTSLKKPTDVESVAKTVSFLISDDSRSITGQVLHVDNGTI